MAKYIEREALLKDLIIAKDGTRIPDVDCDNFPITISIRDLKKLIRKQPTADVVPRAEVEELKGELAIARLHEKNARALFKDAVVSLQEAKQEVAREIFAEIEKLFIDGCDVYHTMEPTDYSELKCRYLEE